MIPVALAVAACCKCSERFRLIWRIGKRKLQPSQTIRLTCLQCGHQFDQIAVRLVVFDAGSEQFPKSAVIDKSALAEGFGGRDSP
jgi:hypothetical protein